MFYLEDNTFTYKSIREGILKTKKLRIERDNGLAEQRQKSDPIQNPFCENRQTVCRLLLPIVFLPDLFRLGGQ
jgi:hypothetical protein